MTTSTFDKEEVRLQGAPASEGIAIGRFFYIAATIDKGPKREIALEVGDIDQEIERYRQARASSRSELLLLQTRLLSEGSKEEAVGIIDTHIQMLDDPLITTEMEEKIRHEQLDTKTVFRSVIEDYKKKFPKQNSFFQQRLVDVMDVSKRILGHLGEQAKPTFTSIPRGSIVFTESIDPSEMAALDRHFVNGLITESGGGSSHSAIIARAKGIPYISHISIDDIDNLLRCVVIIDGKQGLVIFHPNDETLSHYRVLIKGEQTRYFHMQTRGYLKAQTYDGLPIGVHLNCGDLSDLANLKMQGVDGVGLFRSEYLFLRDESLFLSEERQYEIYRALLEKAHHIPFIFRIMDLGGDKFPKVSFGWGHEENPVMGCRGIRFLLSRPEVFRVQLRAILRASPFGKLKILLPLISELNELFKAKKIIYEVVEELRSEGKEVARDIPIGSMVEVPSTVISIEHMAQESDFLSIGTNDLVQYILGADRSTPGMGNFYLPTHPAVMRMIKMVALAGKKWDKSVAICGEIASSPIFIPLLLGLGIEHVSCAGRYIPQIKEVIRKVSIVQAYDLADRVMRMRTSQEVRAVLLEECSPLLPVEE